MSNKITTINIDSPMNKTYVIGGFYDFDSVSWEVVSLGPDYKNALAVKLTDSQSENSVVLINPEEIMLKLEAAKKIMDETEVENVTFCFDSYLESRKFNRKVYTKAAESAIKLIKERMVVPRNERINLKFGMSAKYQTPYVIIETEMIQERWTAADIVEEAFDDYFNSIHIQESNGGDAELTFAD
jgi:hypothetical protein